MGRGLGVWLLADVAKRAIDLYRNGPTSMSAAQLSGLFPASVPLPLSESVVPTSGIFTKWTQIHALWEILPEIVIWTSKTFIILLLGTEFCMEAKKYPEDFSHPQRVDTLEPVPHINVENFIFHLKENHILCKGGLRSHLSAVFGIHHLPSWTLMSSLVGQGLISMASSSLLIWWYFYLENVTKVPERGNGNQWFSSPHTECLLCTKCWYTEMTKV